MVIPDGHPPLKEHVEKCVARGVYDCTILRSILMKSGKN